MNGDDRERGAIIARLEHVEGEIEKLRAWKHQQGNLESVVRAVETLYKEQQQDLRDLKAAIETLDQQDREFIRWPLVRVLLPWFVAVFGGGASVALWLLERR